MTFRNFRLSLNHIEIQKIERFLKDAYGERAQYNIYKLTRTVNIACLGLRLKLTSEANPTIPVHRNMVFFQPGSNSEGKRAQWTMIKSFL